MLLPIYRCFLQALLPLSTVLVGTALAQGVSSTEAGGYQLQGPYSHKNLQVYVIRGRQSLPAGERYVGIDQAMAQKILVVHETGDVNELAVENRSADETVYLQAGDIVRGGKQDRVLGMDLLVPPKSGKLPIASFCVESGRWAPRGREEARTFNASQYAVFGKGMRHAVKSRHKSQAAVWNQVASTQGKLSKNLDKEIRKHESATSLQLSLEDGDLRAQGEDYRKALQALPGAAPDAIGYAFLVNGQFSSAEVYGSADLLQQRWPRILTAMVNEAIAEYKDGAAAKPVDAQWMAKVFAAPPKAATTDVHKLSSGLQSVTTEYDEHIRYDTVQAKGAQLVHRSWDSKGAEYEQLRSPQPQSQNIQPQDIELHNSRVPPLNRRDSQSDE